MDRITGSAFERNGCVTSITLRVPGSDYRWAAAGVD
jgi:hypothetical protein